MDSKLEQSIGIVGKGVSEEVSVMDYKAACEYIIRNRSSLTYRVFIELPGGLSGNSNPDWTYVKENSASRCNCGNERIILPANLRTEYEPGSQQLIVSPKGEIYLKPIGGPKSSAYIKFWIENEALGFLLNPFNPNGLDAVFPKGYLLDKLSEGVKNSHGNLMAFTNDGHIPIFSFNEVIIKDLTVKLTPDKDVESFNPEAMKDDCGCKQPTFTIYSFKS